MMAGPVDAATRKKVLKVIVISLLLDLVRPPLPSVVLLTVSSTNRALANN